MLLRCLVLSLLAASLAACHLDTLDLEYDTFDSVEIDGMDSAVGLYEGVPKFGKRAVTHTTDTVTGLEQIINSQGTVPISDWDIQTIVLRPGEVSSVFAYNLETSSSAYISTYFLSANILSYPNQDVKSWSRTQMDDYFGFYMYLNDTHSPYSESFEDGYAADIAFFRNDLEALSGTIWVQVHFADNSTYFNDTDELVIEFAVSNQEIVFQWDNSTMVTLVDTDDDSAFFITSKFNTSQESVQEWMNETQQLQFYVFDADGYAALDGLTKSWLAVTSAETVVSSSNIEKIYTQSNGGLQEQFFISGLNDSTVYYAIVTNNFDGDSMGGIVYAEVKFITQEQGACELIYSLDFCDTVAYSVPQSSQFKEDKNKTALKTLYDSYAEAAYTNFSYAMQQISCDVELDVRFSPIATCQDCENSYKNWLCAVMIPRCTTGSNDALKARAAGQMRTPELSSRINPQEAYNEVLPCIDMCYAIVRDCPSDFGFSCPQYEDLLEVSYSYWNDSSDYASCNNVGNGTADARKSGASSLSISSALTLVAAIWVAV